MAIPIYYELHDGNWHWILKLYSHDEQAEEVDDPFVALAEEPTVEGGATFLKHQQKDKPLDISWRTHLA